MNLSIYFVTPDVAVHPVEDLVLAAVRGGATIVQLRDKTSTDAQMTERARRLRALLVPFDVPLVINDRLAVMLASGAEGLHVGQTDAPVAEMRRRIGPDRILGLSIETEAQLAAMPASGVDYIGAGPIRSTASKADHAAPIGMDGLARIARAAKVPTVAIGGLKLTDVASVKAAGAAGLAVISAIADADDPEAAASAFALAWRLA
jgi:thiamine-phosphate pyrophosphorylase